MMGLFGGNAPQVLQPVHPPLGVLPIYCVNEPVTMILKEKAFSWSGDDFAVNDTNGKVVVRCRGKAFSFRDRKVITDANGTCLFNLRDKALTIHKIYVAEDDQGREIFRVRKRVSFGTKMEATFVNQSTNQEITLMLRGDMWGGSADITLGEGGQPVAQIARKLFNMREMFLDQQTLTLPVGQKYFVTVAPGVDLALMAAICICFDEAKNEDNR